MTLFLYGRAVSGDPLFRRRSRIAHERALAQSERYRYLDAKKHRTADEFFEYLSLPREITPPTALMRLYWWWEHQPFLSAPVATVCSYVQRARRGWSTGDTRTLSVAELRGRHLAHPAQLTSGEWDEILDQIVEGFKAAVRRDELPAVHPHWVVLEIKRQRAFELLNKWWCHLWD